MQILCRFIARGTATAFLFFSYIYNANATPLSVQSKDLESPLPATSSPNLGSAIHSATDRPSDVDISTQKPKNADLNKPFSTQAQDLGTEDLEQQLQPIAEPTNNLAPPIPSPEPESLEKPAQVPAKLDDLLSNPNLLQNPTKPEDVKIQKVQPITLQQAIELAQQNSRQLQTARVQLDRSRASLREANAAWFPTLGFQSTYSRDISASGELSVEASRLQAREQVSLLQSQLNQLLNAATPTDPSELLARELSIQQAQSQVASAQSSLQDLENFATRTFSGTLGANYTVFTSGQRPALVRAAREQVRVSELEVERVSEQIRLEVAQAYYDLQQTDYQILIQEAAVKEATKSLNDAEALLRAALATRLDVLNAQVQLDNSTQQLTQAQSDQATARRRLAQLLSLPPSISVSAADPVEITERWNLTLEESIIRALNNRVELKQQLAQRSANQQQRKATIAALLPQLSIFANYNLLDAQTDQTGDFIADGFATGYSLGFTFQWTFFDGGATFARIAQQDANIKLNEIQFAQISAQVRFEVEQAYFNLQSNLKNVQVARASLDRAKEALRIARLRFQADVGTQLDVLNAETNLTRAQVNLLQAILGYNRALASLKRAVSGTIPT